MHWQPKMRMVVLFLTGCVAAKRVVVVPPPMITAQAAVPFDAGIETPDANDVLVDAAPDASVVGVDELELATEEADDPGPEEPGEALVTQDAVSDAGWRYTTNWTDEALAKAWREDLPSLGSISMGFVEEGRLINGVRFPAGDGWTVVSPEATWGTQETIDFVAAAVAQVKAWYPNAPPLRINQISAPEGGFLRPHKTHQNGRDVDLGFYYPGGETVRTREREKVIDVALTWALVKALAMHGDVQFILVDQRVSKVLYEHARQAGENGAWLDSLFHAGANSLLHHARRHRDHFHVRYFNAKAQELGRRVAPLLAQRPEENIALHRVRAGDTLGGIASRYGSTVATIKRASGLSSHLLRIGRVLKVPLRKPCTTCPVPPATIVPPRRLPPEPAPSASAPSSPAALAN